MPSETSAPVSTLNRLADSFRRFEFPGDALLILYFIIFARQYLWWLTDNNGVAWLASTLVALVIAYFYFSTVERLPSERAALPFYLVVVLPLVFVYAMRVAFPDLSFDVLNYRLLHSERSLVGFLYRPGDFFPTPAPYNPAPDMVTGLFRHALGYRLGTLPNLLVMIWAGRIIDKLVQLFLRNTWLRAGAVLIVLMAEHLLFEINNYMADLLALPLLLEATYLALYHAEFKRPQRNLAAIALLLGMSVAFKLTNVAMALPIVLLCVQRAVSRTRERRGQGISAAKELALSSVLCAAAFIAPLFPFSAYLYRETGSVVFPVLNGIFKSAYWPLDNGWDPRWGPKGLFEKLLWPLLVTFEPARMSELAVYSGRISFGFCAALIGLVVVRKVPQLRELCCLVVAAALLWSASTGYIRYAFYLEVISAITIIALAARLVSKDRAALKIIGTALGLVLLVQAGLAMRYVSRTEWGARPTFLTSARNYRHEARYFLRDRSLRSFVDPETLKRFDDVDVWVVSSIKAAGLQALLQPRAPMIGVHTYEFFRSDEGRHRLATAIGSAAGKRIYSLALREDFEGAKVNLERRGLFAKQFAPVEIPFYSRDLRLQAFLIEVSTLDPDYGASIVAKEQPTVMKAGAKVALQFTVRNFGRRTWLARTPEGWHNVVTLADRWLQPDGKTVVNNMDTRTMLPHDLNRGDETALELTVTVPQVPGEYILEIDMVHEGVTWFYEQGSPTLRWTITVEK